MPTIERKYQLARIGSGDYLLPSNDGKTLWRISRYDEDGSLSYVDGRTGRERVVTGSFWGFAYYRGTPEEFSADCDGWDDPLEWTDRLWRHFGFGYKTRADAIADALVASPA